MKIRCDQNSIRIRVRKSELVQLRAEQWLAASLHFPDGQVFTWELILDEQAGELQAHYAEGRIRIHLPPPAAREWMESDAVGLERFLPTGGGATLHLLIEKDFPCKDRAGEDKSDFFTELAEVTPVTC